MAEIRTAFVSSTSVDLEEYRQGAFKAIDGLSNWKAFGMERFGARGTPPPDVCRAEVLQCDVLVLILGMRYGSYVAGSDISYTEMEFEAASEAGKPVFAYLLPEDAQQPVSLREPDEKWAKQRVLRERVLAECTAQSVGSPENLGAEIRKTLYEEYGPPSERDSVYQVAAGASDADATVSDESVPEDAEPEGSRDTPTLQTAICAQATAQHGPDDFGALSSGAAAVSAGGPVAYWFLRSATSPAWLPKLRHLLTCLIQARDDKALWALGDMLSAVGAADPNVVVDSGLIEELLRGGERPARMAAVWAIQSTGAWNDGRIRDALSKAPADLDAAGFMHLIDAMTDYGRESPESLAVVLSYFDSWLSVGLPDEQVRKAVTTRISRALSELVEGQKEAAAEHAAKIIDLDVRADNDRSIERALRFGKSGRPDDRAAIRVRQWLVEALADDDGAAPVVELLEGLAAADAPTKKMLALDLAKEAPAKCGAVLLRLVHDPLSFTYPLGQWTRYLLHTSFSTLTPEQQDTIEQAVLAVPDQLADEGLTRAKYFALRAIPPNLLSAPVQEEIRRLLAADPSLANITGQIEKPGHAPESCAYFVHEGPPAPEIGERMDDPAALVPWLHEQLNEEQDEWTDPVHVHVERGLKEEPSRIEPLATVMSEEGDKLPVRYFIAVASAVRAKADDLDGDTVVRIAEALDVVRNSTVRDEMAPSLAGRWQDMSEAAQQMALKLLRSWADPATESQPTVEETERALSKQPDAVQFGLNTARGAAALALVDILRQAGEDEPPPGVIEPLWALTRDPSVGVRAVLAWYLRNIAHLAHLRDWRIEAAKSLLHDFHPLVMPLTHLLLRDLTQTEIEEFGASVVRVMLRSGEQAAGAGGFLAAIWHLRHPETLAEQLVGEVLHGDSPEARAEAAHVFAYNVSDEAKGVASECITRCQQLLMDDDAGVRRAVATNIEFGDNPSEDVLTLLRKLGEDSDTDVLGQLDMKLLREVSATGAPRAPVIAAIIEGLAANECEEAQLEFIRSISHRLQRVFGILSSTGYRDLALRLLDRCCYHCIPAAAPLIAALEPGDLE